MSGAALEDLPGTPISQGDLLQMAEQRQCNIGICASYAHLARGLRPLEPSFPDAGEFLNLQLRLTGGKTDLHRCRYLPNFPEPLALTISLICNNLADLLPSSGALCGSGKKEENLAHMEET